MKGSASQPWQNLLGRWAVTRTQFPPPPDWGLPPPPIGLLLLSGGSIKQEKWFHLITWVIFSKIGFFLTVFHEEQKRTWEAAKLPSLLAFALGRGLAWKGKCLWSRLQFSIHLEGWQPQCCFMKWNGHFERGKYMGVKCFWHKPESSC